LFLKIALKVGLFLILSGLILFKENKKNYI